MTPRGSPVSRRAILERQVGAMPLTMLDGLGFAADPLDRLSYRRDDADDVARLRARGDARAIFIARDMPLLLKNGAELVPLFPMSEVERLGGARVEALMGVMPDGAPVFAVLLNDEAV